MLFVLTGDIQTGKTRWLMHLVNMLRGIGVECRGVVAPGVWRDWRYVDELPDTVAAHVDANGFEKLGIDNVLLPGAKRVAFAKRGDLVGAKEAAHAKQSKAARLMWSIDDAAIARVNAHFSALASEKSCNDAPGLLVVDELGRLELMRGQGLDQAIAVLEAGPTATTSCALVVVRSGLRELVHGRFSAWGPQEDLAPDVDSCARVMQVFGA